MLNDRALARSALLSRKPGPALSVSYPPDCRKIVSWNLLRRTGATVAGIATLIAHEQPDLVLMQEATKDIEGLPAKAGGHYAWAQMPGRIHGLAIWSRKPFARPPEVIELPGGTLFDRVCQVLDLGDFGIANVHLSHGQVLNRRQLRRIERSLPERAAVIGDYNLVGPPLLPGFRDVEPRRPTHAMGRLVPLRLDRCLVRGLACHAHSALPRGASDHRPITVHLAPSGEMSRPEISRFRDMAARVGRWRREGAREASAPTDPQG